MGSLIAVGNLKGGTGKSTIAVNVACALVQDGYEVALIDADGQGTSTDWHAGHRLPVRVESWPLGGERDAQRWVARVLALKPCVDRIIVDLPPQIGSGIASALLIADLFVVPVTPSGVDLRATAKALALLRRARCARRRQAGLHAGAEPGRPRHGDRSAHPRPARALRAQGRPAAA